MYQTHLECMDAFYTQYEKTTRFKAGDRVFKDSAPHFTGIVAEVIDPEYPTYDFVYLVIKLDNGYTIMDSSRFWLVFN